jgi:hypothetical protein
MMHTLQQSSENNTYEVGYWNNGNWCRIVVTDSMRDAARCVNFLNGGEGKLERGVLYDLYGLYDTK